jgi:hypothetical protein
MADLAPPAQEPDALSCQKIYPQIFGGERRFG